MLRNTLFLLSLGLLFLQGCSRERFTISGRFTCVDDFHEIEMVCTHVETGEVFQIPVSGSGDYKLEDMPAGSYSYEVDAMDEGGTIRVHHSEGVVILPSGALRGPLSFRAPWESQRIELMNDGYHAFFEFRGTQCNYPRTLQFFVSENDPGTFEDPETFFTDSFMVYEEEFGSEQVIDIRFGQVGVYYGTQWSSRDSWTRSIPEQFGGDDVPVLNVEQGTLYDLSVPSDEEAWFEVQVRANEPCIIEYFDINTKNVSGRDLLVSCYDPITGEALFERRPLQPEDGCPAAVWSKEGGRFLFKAEIDPVDGTPGRFQLFAPQTLGNGEEGISRTVLLADFSSVFKEYYETVEAGEHTFASFEMDSTARSLRYWLFNVTTGETIFQDMAPSEDLNDVLTLNFTLQQQSELRLIVTKAYWGDFNNTVWFELD